MPIIYNTYKIKVSKLFCDKLSFTIDYLNMDEQQHILDTLQDMAEYGQLKNAYGGKWYKKCMKGYVGKYQKSLNRMLIQCDPKQPGFGFLSVDFNPAHADMEFIHALLNELLPGGWDDILLKAKFTRFDMAVDLEGISPDQLLAYYPQMQISAVYCKSGQTETLSIGCYGGNKNITIYDKVKQVKDKNKKQNLNLPPPAKETTRVEISISPDCSFDQLGMIQNPFAKLVIRAFADFPKVEEELWRMFVALAQFRGAQDALLILDEGTRKKFKQKIENVVCPWWNPESIWNNWEDLLMEVFMLKSQHPLAA